VLGHDGPGWALRGSVTGAGAEPDSTTRTRLGRTESGVRARRLDKGMTRTVLMCHE
jgi:hypothetical protein